MGCPPDRRDAFHFVPRGLDQNFGSSSQPSTGARRGHTQVHIVLSVQSFLGHARDERWVMDGIRNRVTRCAAQLISIPKQSCPALDRDIDLYPCHMPQSYKYLTYDSVGNCKIPSDPFESYSVSRVTFSPHVPVSR